MSGACSTLLLPEGEIKCQSVLNHILQCCAEIKLPILRLSFRQELREWPYGRHQCKARCVGVETDGQPLTTANLPPAHTKRWVASRKAAIVAAVRDGLISLDDACGRYALSADELLAWRSAFDNAGQSGLQVRRLQDNRRS